jgi:mannose-6-phosphate isomerase-like protein (cupin superfamily)
MIEYVVSLERQTLENKDFRHVIFTGIHTQLVLMCLAPGENTGDEVHQGVDQFFRIESGDATFIFDQMKTQAVHGGDAVVVPAGTYHNVVNSSTVEPLKFYTIYSPPHHPDGTIHGTKADAEEAKAIEENYEQCITSMHAS